MSSFTMATRRNPVAMSSAKAPRTSRAVPTVEATRPGRREALGYVATVLAGAALWRASPAEAIEIPFKESIGGREPTSTSEQSMLAYDMEGIKKTALSQSEKKKLLAEVRERALETPEKKKK